MTEIILKDASIIIDLLKIGLFPKVVLLPFKFYTTDFILAEIVDDQQRLLLEKFVELGSIHIIESEADALIDISRLFNSVWGKLSFADCSVLYFAEKLKATIFTGDYRLRKEAEKRKINAHGILWIFETLIEHKAITHKSASQKLKMLMEQNTYLPKTECEKYLRKWSKTD